MLNHLEIDYLREFTTICVGHAANRMALLLPFPVMITLPQVKISRILTHHFFQQKGKYGHSLLITVRGDFRAIIVINLSRETPRLIMEHLPYKLETSEDEYQKLYQSMIREMGNILGSAYSTAVEQCTGFFLLPNVPDFMYSEQQIESLFLENWQEELHNSFVYLYSDILVSPLNICIQFFTILSNREVRKILDKREGFSW